MTDRSRLEEATGELRDKSHPWLDRWRWILPWKDRAVMCLLWGWIGSNIATFFTSSELLGTISQTLAVPTVVWVLCYAFKNPVDITFKTGGWKNRIAAGLLIGFIAAAYSDYSEYRARSQNALQPSWAEFSLRERRISEGLDPDSWARPTADYWKVAVAPLYEIGISEPPLGNEKLQEFMLQFLAKYRTALEKAKAASTEDVDPEVLEMVERHTSIDEACIYLQIKNLHLIDDWSRTPDTMTIRQRISMLEEEPAKLTNEQLQKLPPEISQHLLDMGTLQDALVNQQQEVVAMQARLSRRFREQSFPLAGIEEESSGWFGW